MTLKAFSQQLCEAKSGSRKLIIFSAMRLTPPIRAFESELSAIAPELDEKVWERVWAIAGALAISEGSIAPGVQLTADTRSATRPQTASTDFVTTWHGMQSSS